MNVLPMIPYKVKVAAANGTTQYNTQSTVLRPIKLSPSEFDVGTGSYCSLFISFQKHNLHPKSYLLLYSTSAEGLLVLQPALRQRCYS